MYHKNADADVDAVCHQSTSTSTTRSCLEQWRSITESPMLLRWWHVAATCIDACIVGTVYGWAWYVRGASWRIVPTGLYLFGRMMITSSTFINGPETLVARGGLFLALCELYMSTYPMLQAAEKRPFGSTGIHLAASAANMFLTHFPARVVGRVMDTTSKYQLTLKNDVLWSGAFAVMWRVDSMTDMQVVYIIYSKATSGVCPSINGVLRCDVVWRLFYVQAVLASIANILSQIQQFMTKHTVQEGRSMAWLFLNVSAALAELGEIAVTAMTIYLDVRHGSSSGSARPSVPSSCSVRTGIAVMASSAVLTMVFLVINILGVNAVLSRMFNAKCHAKQAAVVMSQLAAAAVTTVADTATGAVRSRIASMLGIAFQSSTVAPSQLAVTLFGRATVSRETIVVGVDGVDADTACTVAVPIED